MIKCSDSEHTSQVKKNEKKVIQITPEVKSAVTDYQQLIEEIIANNEAPIGMAIGIVKDGNVLLQKGYGLRSIKTNEVVNEHTVFRIASLSKGFGSGLAATFVRDNLMDWNSKPKDLLPNFSLHNDSSTQLLEMQHILSHTSGLPRHTYGNLIEANISLEKMISRLKEVPTIAKPGELLAYQNVAYSIVQPMLEKIANDKFGLSGKSFASMMKARIYDPLKMKNASTDFVSIKNHSNFALPHNRSKTKLIQLDSSYFSVLPAAGVNASITDMNKWLLAMLGHQADVFPKNILEDLTKRRIVLPKNNPWSRSWEGIDSVGYGLGWRVVDYKGLELIYHGGYVNGYRAEMAFCKKEDIGIVLLSNSYSRFFHRSVPEFFDLYLSRKILNKKDSLKNVGKDLQLQN